MITIINYGSGNIRAIGNIYDKLKVPYTVAHNPAQLQGATHIILPGVGAFDETMSMLRLSGFIEPLEEQVLEKKTPVLGICVGMQILSEGSDEGTLPGLGWIGGRVRKINKDLIAHVPKLPHLGWNSVSFRKPSPLLEGIDPKEGFYFIHSYYFDAQQDADVLTQTNYGQAFTSAVQRENIHGVQFHPEKSHSNGITLLKNFAAL